MKTIFFAIFLVFGLFFSLAQEDIKPDEVSPEANSELKVNALYLVLGAFEVTYEHILSEESGIGVSVFLPYDSDIKDEIQYYISPYFRYYFGNKYATGFFLEGFGMLNSTERSFDIFFEEPEDDFVTDFALGIGLGGKWVTKKGFVGEISFGVGRNLFNSDEGLYEFVSKGAITVGYRF